MGVALPFPLAADASLACCKVGLDRPLIPAAFAANLFRSARVSRLRADGRGLEDGRSQRTGGAGDHCPNQSSRYLVEAAQRRQIGAWRRQPQVTAIGQSDPLPSTPPGQWSVRRQRFGVNPPGLGRVRDECSFVAWGPPGSNMPPHSGLGCKGQERIFNGATAMKPWKTSSATNETPSARPLVLQLVRTEGRIGAKTLRPCAGSPRTRRVISCASWPRKASWLWSAGDGEPIIAPSDHVENADSVFPNRALGV